MVSTYGGQRPVVVPGNGLDRFPLLTEQLVRRLGRMPACRGAWLRQLGRSGPWVPGRALYGCVSAWQRSMALRDLGGPKGRQMGMQGRPLARSRQSGSQGRRPGLVCAGTRARAHMRVWAAEGCHGRPEGLHGPPSAIPPKGERSKVAGRKISSRKAAFLAYVRTHA
jgi:hypothetical protein